MPTGELNRFVEKITTASPPVTSGKRNVRVLYAAQTSVAPPTFVLFTNSEAKLHFSYERFLENRLRESYGFFGTPIRIQVRGRKDSRGTQRAQDRRGTRAGSPQAREERARARSRREADRARRRQARRQRAAQACVTGGAERRR